MSGQPARRKSTGEHVLSGFGLLLAVLLAIAGLTIVGFFVVIMVGMAHYGSNK